MKRIIDRGEIDHDNGGICRETTRSKCAVFAEKLRMIRNPYTGNKRKLLVNLFTTIESHGKKYDTFLDLFTGSGMVAATARYLGKKVVANDLSPYAYQNARFFLESEKGLELDKDDIEHILLPNMVGIDFVKTHYSERFTAEEAQFLDCIRQGINVYLPGGRCGGQSIQSTIALLSVLHYVMDHCFVGGRLNKGQVLAELDHRISHQRNEGKAMSFRDLEWLRPFVTGPVGYASNEDAIGLLAGFDKKGIVHDLAYIDPPYGSDQSDYAAMYKFFNEYITLKHEEPDINASRFIKTKGYDKEFDDLLDALKKIPQLVFSYNDSSWCKIEGIVSAIQRFRGDVVVEKVDYSYGYRDQSNPAQEYIILAE